MASERLHAHANVEVMHAWVPAQWPAETFDLIVLSEFGFYLDGPTLDALADRVLRMEDGRLVADDALVLAQ